MLTVRLDQGTEQQLAELLAYSKDSNCSELIKRLIRERWLSLQLGKTIVERRGGHPHHLLEDAPPTQWLLSSHQRTQNELLLDVAKEIYECVPLLPQDFSRIAELNAQYADLPGDFAD